MLWLVAHNFIWTTVHYFSHAISKLRLFSYGFQSLIVVLLLKVCKYWCGCCICFFKIFIDDWHAVFMQRDANFVAGLLLKYTNETIAQIYVLTGKPDGINMAQSGETLNQKEVACFLFVRVGKFYSLNFLNLIKSQANFG